MEKKNTAKPLAVLSALFWRSLFFKGGPREMNICLEKLPRHHPGSLQPSLEQPRHRSTLILHHLLSLASSCCASGTFPRSRPARGSRESGQGGSGGFQGMVQDAGQATAGEVGISGCTSLGFAMGGLTRGAKKSHEMSKMIR